MKKINKTAAFILAAALVIFTLPHAAADGDIITIESKEDFKEFAAKCTLNTFSQGKTVNLTCSIDMGGEEFSPIPTFGGKFNGNGYTISGINLSKSGSNMGLFRYIQQGGSVSNLTVSGSFAPGGSKSFLGGIAGENEGLIDSCHFDGVISGDNVIGGIAGKNTGTGLIIDCTAKGSITGENSVGGIAGKNEGQLLRCTNEAQVNTVYKEKKRDITDIDADAGSIVETYMTEKDENEEDNILGHTDTGGIAGYNSGILQGCKNTSDVGHPHVGYNIGGIAGRQSGYMLGCENSGTIRGRKDVGGIVGQMEPYILLDVSEVTLQSLRDELARLHSMTEHFTSDADSLDSDTQSHLNNLSQQSAKARANAQTLLNQGTDFVDDSLDELDAQTAIISNSVDKLSSSFDYLAAGAEDAEDAIIKTKDALNSIELADPDFRKHSDEINTALDEIKYAEGSLNNAAKNASKAADKLADGFGTKNVKKTNEAIGDLSNALGQMISAKNTINKSVGDIETTIKTRPESFEAIGVNTRQILDDLKNIRETAAGSASSIKTVADSLDTIILNSDLDVRDIQTALRSLDSAFSNLSAGTSSVTQNLSGLRSALGDTIDDAEGYSDDTKEQLKAAKAELSDALTSLGYAAEDIKTAMDGIEKNVSDLSGENGLSFTRPGSDFKEANDNLFESLTGISDEISKLRGSVSDGTRKASNNIKAISNQFDLVMNLILNEAEQTQNLGDISEIILDVSDEDIENTKQGKVTECRNTGDVIADRNTGGITGSLAIEYAKDPENDIEKPDTLNFTYRTKAILQSCVNDGDIESKKDCAGGVAGLAEIGTVYSCENYGSIESTNGDYVGGVAGKSETGIKKCYAKCSCTGNRYVGGIAGKAGNLSLCYSIASIDGEEALGAVLGGCDSREHINLNFCLDNGLGAIDGISYLGLAEPITYETLCKIASIPQRMISFTVSFIADDEVIDTQEIKYGESTSRINYPEPPAKDGMFGSWQEPEDETVTEDIDIYCEYNPYINILASDEKNGNGKLSLALAEGEFTDKSRLTVSESKKEPGKTALGTTKVYDIKLLNTSVGDTDTVTLRLLNENKDDVKAWCLNGNTWEQTDVTKRGKYVIIKVKGPENTICLQYTKSKLKYLWLILIVLALGAAAFVIIKKRTSSPQS